MRVLRSGGVVVVVLGSGVDILEGVGVGLGGMNGWHF
jgi:hypothetical protein